jgi:hypothetical protein
MAARRCRVAAMHCATPTPRLKAAVGTACRASRQPPRPRRSPPDSALPRARRCRLDRLLADRIVVSTASSTASSSQPFRQPRRRPDRVVVPTIASAEAKPGRAPCGRGRASVPSAGRPSGTRLNFIIFRFIQFSANSKKLCRIHLNSENYETNFVGKF